MQFLPISVISSWIMVILASLFLLPIILLIVWKSIFKRGIVLQLCFCPHLLSLSCLSLTIATQLILPMHGSGIVALIHSHSKHTSFISTLCLLYTTSRQALSFLYLVSETHVHYLTSIICLRASGQGYTGMGQLVGQAPTRVDRVWVYWDGDSRCIG